MSIISLVHCYQLGNHDNTNKEQQPVTATTTKVATAITATATTVATATTICHQISSIVTAVAIAITAEITTVVATPYHNSSKNNKISNNNRSNNNKSSNNSSNINNTNNIVKTTIAVTTATLPTQTVFHKYNNELHRALGMNPSQASCREPLFLSQPTIKLGLKPVCLCEEGRKPRERIVSTSIKND
ncbi:hypothetical protein ACTFIU_002705 [Dictyostelium citrinum]